MSRVGKHPIIIPSGVKVALDGCVLSGNSQNGKFQYTVPAGVLVELSDKSVCFKPENDSQQSRALWGTSRSIVAKSVSGLVSPFVKRVNLIGVGYKAAVQGDKLIMQLGYSHDIVFSIPSDIKIVCEKQTTIAVSGIDKQRVGQVIKQLQCYRKPEPYKGKGVIIDGQFVYRKEGKKK